MSRSSATRSAASSTRSRRRCPCPSWATSRSTACSSGPRSSSRSGPTSTSWRGSMTAGSWRIGMFSLFRLPLVAFRPHDLLLVYETDRRVAGLVRVERESWRDDWTFVELDAIGARDSGEIRYRLVQQVLREGQKRGAAPFHVACADADDNVEPFIQIGIATENQPHYLRVLGRPEVDLTPIIDFGLGEIRARMGRDGAGPNHGVLAPVRTYEAPADRRLEEASFGEIATVTLLLRETLVRVADPALVPAAVRPWEVTRGS